MIHLRSVLDCQSVVYNTLVFTPRQLDLLPRPPNSSTCAPSFAGLSPNVVRLRDPVLCRANRITRAWETGMVWVNTWLLRDLRVPFGGVKESGVGREGGRHSLDFYSQLKNICVKL